MPDIPHRLFEDCGSEIVYSVKKVSKDPFLRNAVSQTLKFALLVTSIKDKILVLGKFYDHSNHVLIWTKSQQLAGKAAMSGSHKQLSERGLRHRSLFLALKEFLMCLVLNSITNNLR